jgi:MerR family transcriptional regulator, thiopeptide resistance regulator
MNMKPYRISQLARLFGLSRSTLLYYDRIGLLQPSGRTDAGYRFYTETDRERLERICRFRQAGLSLADIRNLLAADGEPSVGVLEKRFREINNEIIDLRAKQSLLSHMLKNLASDTFSQKVDKKIWVEMLRSAGMDDQGMKRWHGAFEARAPEAHHEFLLSLGISEPEALEIRKWSRKFNKTGKMKRPGNRKGTI